jgi:hypothetical protein
VTTITILGKNAYYTPDPVPPTKSQKLKSHHKHLDHAAEIAWGLTELQELYERDEFLMNATSSDAWQEQEWNEELADIPIKVMQVVGDISAHLGYLGDGEVVKQIGMGIDPELMWWVGFWVPGCLTGNWQWLAREVCPI